MCCLLLYVSSHLCYNEITRALRVQQRLKALPKASELSFDPHAEMLAGMIQNTQ